MNQLPFRDRREAGRLLAGKLAAYANRPDVLVLALRETLRDPKLKRAIGVIYRPDTERQSHYFHARLADQFDAVLHFDETRAVAPLEPTADWEAGEVPETFPFGV